MSSDDKKQKSKDKKKDKEKDKKKKDKSEKDKKKDKKNKKSKNEEPEEEKREEKKQENNFVHALYTPTFQYPHTFQIHVQYPNVNFEKLDEFSRKMSDLQFMINSQLIPKRQQTISQVD